MPYPRPGDWWDPAAKWARRVLERAEDECCDARVVSLLSASAAAYTRALVATATFVSYAYGSGRVDAAMTVSVRSRVSGMMVKVSCQPGQAVRRGDVLFELDARPYKAELEGRGRGPGRESETRGQGRRDPSGIEHP